MRGINRHLCDRRLHGERLAKGMEGVVTSFVDGIRHDIFGGPLGKVAGSSRSAASRSSEAAWTTTLCVAPLLRVAGISVVTHGRAKANMMRRAIESRRARRSRRDCSTRSVRASHQQR